MMKSQSNLIVLFSKLLVLEIKKCQHNTFELVLLITADIGEIVVVIFVLTRGKQTLLCFFPS